MVTQIDGDCKKAGIGCTDCKKMLAQNIARALSPVHERMEYYSGHLAEIEAIIEDGNTKATKIARQTMDEVRAAVKI